jgi:hypothetical protein
VQRLEDLQRLVLWSLVGKRNFMQHRMPNPSVKRTVNSGPHLAVLGGAVPLLPSAYLIR